MVYIGTKNCDVPVVSVCHKNPSIWVPGKVFVRGWGIVTAQWRIYILGVPLQIKISLNSWSLGDFLAIYNVNAASQRIDDFLWAILNPSPWYCFTGHQ